MKIYIDADGCPVTDLTVDIAKQHDIKVIIVKNYAHDITNSYASVVTVDIESNSADLYIVNNIKEGDIVISQDYGVAAISIAKKAICITQNGLLINNYNIDNLLHSRHINRQLRRSKKYYGKSKKRSKKDDIAFKNQLLNCLGF